jgi:hypothetical protein
LQSVTLVHVVLQPGAVPQRMSHVEPPAHEHVESLHAHACPVHDGCAVGPHATTTAIAIATDAVTARTLMARELYSAKSVLASFVACRKGSGAPS